VTVASQGGIERVSGLPFPAGPFAWFDLGEPEHPELSSISPDTRWTKGESDGLGKGNVPPNSTFGAGNYLSHSAFPCFGVIEEEESMNWTTPTLVEICIGLEINGYLPAEF